jgi:hypothetical protein
MPNSSQLGSRIVVVGPVCSGKSTLAATLAQRLDIPFVEFDGLFWLPNWVESDDEAFGVKVGGGDGRRRMGSCWQLPAYLSISATDGERSCYSKASRLPLLLEAAAKPKIPRAIDEVWSSARAAKISARSS